MQTNACGVVAGSYGVSVGKAAPATSTSVLFPWTCPLEVKKLYISNTRIEKIKTSPKKCSPIWLLGRDYEDGPFFSG